FAPVLIPSSGGGGIPNTAPTVTITEPADKASFGSGASIAFAGSATDTEDGDLTSSLVWVSNGDGSIGAGGSFSAVLSDGVHTVTATVTDSGGLTDVTSITVTITVDEPPPSTILLTVTPTKIRGTKYADLTWSGATSTRIDVFRNGEELITNTENDGAYSDLIGKAGGTFTYQVCEAGTSACSNEATVTF
ncbi:MAG: hypothetical protein R6W77_14120, partial [Trueperaceae bacterium]